jgi:hypothetical protein
MAKSLEKMLNSDRRLCARDPFEYPLFDMTKFFLRPSLPLFRTFYSENPDDLVWVCWASSYSTGCLPTLLYFRFQSFKVSTFQGLTISVLTACSYFETLKP